MSTPSNLQSDDSEGLSLRDSLRVVARWKWLIIGLTLILGAAAFGYSLTQPKQYTATTSLKYEQQVNVANPLGQNYTDPQTVQQELASVSSQLTDPALQAQVAQAVGLQASDKQLTPTATAIPNSNVVTISATAKSPDRAAAIANGYAAAFISANKKAVQLQLVEAENVVKQQLKSYTSAASQRSTEYVLLAQQLQDLRIAAATATGDYLVVSPAVPPTSPSSPHPKRTAAIGLAAGLLLGIALAFLLEQFNTRLRSHREVAEILQLPVVGRVPRIDKQSPGHQPARGHPRPERSGRGVTAPAAQQPRLPQGRRHALERPRHELHARRGQVGDGLQPGRHAGHGRAPGGHHRRRPATAQSAQVHGPGEQGRPVERGGGQGAARRRTAALHPAAAGSGARTAARTATTARNRRGSTS